MSAADATIDRAHADDPPVRPARTFRVVAYGEAKPQGSQQGRFVPRLGRTVKHEKPDVLDWRRRVAQAAGEQCAEVVAGRLVDGPCAIEVVVYRPRPKSAPKRVRFPATAPDADKLLRAIGDALSGVLYTDDARIVDATLRKRFGEPARAEIVLVEYEVTT